MAQPAATFSSYDAIGIREDLSDMIWDVSPSETPFCSSIKKTKATNTLHEWQTDSLAASSTSNAHIEGDDTIADTVSPTVRLNNRTQILKKAIVIPGTDSGLDKAGRGKEMAYQIAKKTKEIKLDLEAIVFNNQAAVAGSDTVPRQMAGMGAWVNTNTANVGGGGAEPTGDGTDARTDGSQTAYSQADQDTVLQSIWENSNKGPDTVYLSAFQQDVALGFVGNNNQRSSIDAGKDEVRNVFDVYVTPWGTVKFVPSRECRSRDVWAVNSDTWAIATLRGLKNTALAKTGDSEKRQLIQEVTLEACNEAASGLVADCSTS